MTTICQETLNVDDTVYFGDIEDVLRKSLERKKSSGGTIIFTTINGANFIADPHLINRYDWKRTCCYGEETAEEMKCYLATIGVQVGEQVLQKLKTTLGTRFCNWTYIIKGNANLNTIAEDDLTLTKVDLQSEDAPKGFYIMKNGQDGSVIGFVCKTVLGGDHEYGALLEDPTMGHFAFIYSDEHIYNTADKSPEELPNKFVGLVNIKDFLKSQ